jgi:hypothetical protein
MNPNSPNENARDADLGKRGPNRMPVDESDNDAPGIAPTKPSSMPRAEDDDKTYDRSPEYRDGRDRIPPPPPTTTGDHGGVS